MNARIALAQSTILVLLSLTANASDLSYTYAELRFVDTEIGNLDGDGLRFGGSYELNHNWLLVGGFTTLDFDANVDTSALEVGVGYVNRYDPKFDLVAYGKIVRAEVEVGNADVDDTGISLAGGIRGRFSPEFEGRATVNYVNVDNSDTFFELGGDYHFSPAFSAGATLEFGGDADSLTIGARWFFGN